MQGDVVFDRAGEQEDILQHLTDRSSQGRDLDVVDVDAIDQNLTLLDFVVANDQRKNRRLSRTGRTDKGTGLLRFDHKGNILQNPVVILIGKPDIFEFDPSFEPVDLDGIRLIQNIRFDIEKIEDPFRCRQSLLQGIELIGQILDRIEELGQIQIESHDLTGGKTKTDTLGKAQSDRTGVDEGDQRTIDAESFDDIEALLAQSFVFL